MKTIAIAWIVVFALNRLVHLMVDSVTPTERVVAKHTGKAPKRMIIATMLYILSFSVAVIITIVEIVMM